MLISFPNSISAVTCEDGFVVDTATNTCENVNECDNGTPCGANADCKDNDGSFVCECHLGWNSGASGKSHFDRSNDHTLLIVPPCGRLK